MTFNGRVALVTGGPGHANALGALYTALASASPMVLISGHAPLAELGKGAFQEMPQAQLAAPLTVASWTVQAVDQLGQDIARALREAHRGPVHVSVPNDVLDALTDSGVATAEPPPEEAQPLPAELLQAKRPLIIAGPGALHGNGRERLARLEFRTRLSAETAKWLVYALLRRRWPMLDDASESVTPHDQLWLRGLRRALCEVAALVGSERGPA